MKCNAKKSPDIQVTFFDLSYNGSIVHSTYKPPHAMKLTMLKVGYFIFLFIPFNALCQSIFPDALVKFKPMVEEAIFSGTGTQTWDEQIRERGYILKEKDGYHMWYTGYTKNDPIKRLGYATSSDGLNWNRHPANPINPKQWIEDVFVIKKGAVYYMFAEGKGDTTHLLVSTNKTAWKELGNLKIKKTNGQPIDKGAFGTPCVMELKGIYYLFYERDDLGIWLAKSNNLIDWVNVQDQPVLEMGPEPYDLYGVAMNQVIYHQGYYYGYYHATAYKDWREWSSNVAVSKDLIHWTKYPHNPIIGNNQSSNILVPEARGFRLYTMHSKVHVYQSK
ncbi:glycosylase [Aquirufa ecclesiirivi]